MTGDQKPSGRSSKADAQQERLPSRLVSDGPKCGIVMPISAIDNCDERHWAEVLEILEDSASVAGFIPSLVSNADDVGVIHKRIIQNLYDNPIVLCHVSCKNPNVMFELGLRLAFDKPTIIIKDDKTAYSFDTAAIEHLEYPRDLRFSQIVEFKKTLSSKLEATYKKSNDDKNYTTFLKHYGQFTVAKIDPIEVSSQEYILEEIRNLRSLILRTRAYRRPSTTSTVLLPSKEDSRNADSSIVKFRIPLVDGENSRQDVISSIRAFVGNFHGVTASKYEEDGDGLLLSLLVQENIFEKNEFQKLINRFV